MSRTKRKEINERCIEIVKNNDIHTQDEFAEIYNKIYKTSIKQPNVSRMFDKANIVYNKDNGLYEVEVKESIGQISDKEKAETSLKNSLSLYSYGKYTHEKGSKIMWLDVDFGLEKVIADLILDYIGSFDVSILCGIGCLYIRARSIATYEELNAFLKKYTKNK